MKKIHLLFYWVSCSPLPFGWDARKKEIELLINNVTPITGKAGDQVTILGTGFGATAAEKYSEFWIHCSNHTDCQFYYHHCNGTEWNFRKSNYNGKHRRSIC